jgi:hypothetical protein
LLAFLPPADRVFGFFQQLIKFFGFIHVFEEFALHFFFCEAIKQSLVYIEMQDQKDGDPWAAYETRFSIMALGTISIIVRRTILKYDVMRSSGITVSKFSPRWLDYSLITSTSCVSFSESVPEAFRVGGGGSIAAIFFLFFDAKKLPKKPELSLPSNEGLADRGGTEGGNGLPVLGSTWVGLAALCRSWMIAIA